MRKFVMRVPVFCHLSPLSDRFVLQNAGSQIGKRVSFEKRSSGPINPNRGCGSAGRRLLRRHRSSVLAFESIRIHKDFFERFAEYARDLESDLERRRVFSEFDRINRLTRYVYTFGEILLRHFVVLESELANDVRDAGFTHVLEPAPVVANTQSVIDDFGNDECLQDDETDADRIRA